MFQYRKYNIRNTDTFRPDDYPKVLVELEEINNRATGLPGVNKGDIIISYLKGNLLKSDLLNANPAFAELVTSGNFDTVHLEALFESCRQNNQFATEYEEYIRKNIP